jgi:uroporphyrinogen decarboxylase
MTHRQRVLTALNREEPDRVPIDIGASVNNLNDGVYHQVKRYLGIEGEIRQFRGLMTATYYDERILEALDVDIRHVWLNDPVEYRAVIDDSFDPMSYTDDWGVEIKREEGRGAFHVQAPLAQASITDLDRYSWPDPEHPLRTEGVKERVEALHAQGEYAIGSNIVGHGGLLEHGCYLRGTEQFLVDLMVEKQLAAALLDRLTDLFIGLYDRLLSVTGPYLDLVYWAEDFGSQTGMLISEDLYVEFFKERHRRIFEFIKSRCPQGKILFHSCGAIYPLIEHLIETGIDVLNPLQPLATDMDPLRIKEEFGDRLCFCGAIDIQKALPGSMEDVETEVKTRIGQLGPGGGYILAPANYIQNNTPAENVVHLCEMARKYGTYPLKV